MARSQPVQVQRVGLNFAKHYALILPLAALYVLIVSVPLVRRTSQNTELGSGNVLFFFGLGVALVVVWFLCGHKLSLFKNPFSGWSQISDERKRRFGDILEEVDNKIIPKEIDGVQIILGEDVERWYGHTTVFTEAKAEVQRLRAEGKKAMTERDYEWMKARKFWRVGLPFFLGYVSSKVPYLLVAHGGAIGLTIIAAVVFFNFNLLGTLFIGVLAFVVPLLFLLWKPAKLIVAHLVEEHPLFVSFFRLGIGGPSGRFAGLRENSRNDMSEHFNPSLEEPPHSETSDIYLGKTPFFEDTRLLGRHVGLKGRDTHMITVARIGSGKSRDAIWNTLLNYSGGVICFDPKGEHFRVTGERRAKTNDVYVIDPYGSVADVRETDIWNPLDEIDIKSDAARDQISNIAESSIFAEKGDQNAFFQENGSKILRGFIAHVMTKYPEKDRHLGTVSDLIATGEPEGKYYSKVSFERVIQEMALNQEFQGAAREAAGILMKVGDRERGSYLSTLARGIDWVNSPAIRRIICGRSTFSLRQAKSEEASIFLVLPDDFISQNSRFLRTFFGMAGEVCGDYITPQPEGSKHRVLMIFDEFSALGYFKPAEEIVLRKRSAGIKCWFLMQNLSQLQQHYKNPENFISSSDKQFFGIDRADSYAMELLVKSLGQYTEGEGRPGQPLPFERTRELFTSSDIAQWTNNDNNGQIVIPAQGKPMKLKRVPFYQNFATNQYGKQKTSA